MALRQHYVILGAGISGLSLAWYLKQRYQHEIDLTILESASRPGGWIQTSLEKGFLFEKGPRSFRPEGSGIATLQLIEDLGLASDYMPASPSAKNRYLYIDGRLKCLPTSLKSLLTSPFLPHIAKALWKDWMTPRGNVDDESIYDFVERRFGDQIASLFFDPFISGIYAGDIHDLSLRSCFPWLAETEQQHRCIWYSAFKRNKAAHLDEDLSPFVKKAKKQGIFSLKNGAESLIHVLAQNFQNALKLNCRVEKIAFENRRSLLTLQNGETLIADKVFSAIPAKQLASLLKEMCPILNTCLNGISSTSIAAINLGYHSPVLQQEGFGYLIPSQEKQRLLGVVWDSSAFPQQNIQFEQTRLTAMVGGTHFKDFAQYQEAEFIEIALKEIEQQLRIRDTPDYISVQRAIAAIPQYSVGHAQNIVKIENAIKQLPGDLILTGNHFYGISVNDCIANAKKLVRCLP